jgi:mono/diheme cytochrome c family protein
MIPMKNLIKLFLAPAVLLTTVSLSAQPDDRAGLVARGRYLVENVGLCADCHTPRNERGEFIAGQSLMGAPLGFAPAFPMPAWAPVAPPIAGLPTMTEAEAVRFMKDGVRPNGSRPLPPMPEFRLNEADATAVVAYLKTLAR